MANVIKTFEITNFRCVKSIDKLTDSELHKQGYYRGYQCPHGHEIRDTKYHWCYECVIKIKSNICGFDLNFLNNDFKNKYYKLWKKIDIKEPKLEERLKLRESQDQSKAQPVTPAAPFLPDPQIANMFAANINPTTGLTPTESALLSPEEQVIARRLRT